MARKKAPGSTRSFDGLGLEKAEEKKLLTLLKDKHLSVTKLKLALVRAYIKDQSIVDLNQI